MTGVLATTLLLLATVAGGFAALSRRPRAMVISVAATGAATAFFLLVLGFEMLALLDLFLSIATAIALHLFAALQGTRGVAEAERAVRRADWIHAVGAFAVLSAVLGFALSQTRSVREIGPELSVRTFPAALLGAYPELSAVIGVALFLLVVTVAWIGRPTWTARAKEDA